MQQGSDAVESTRSGARERNPPFINATAGSPDTVPRFSGVSVGSSEEFDLISHLVQELVQL